MAKKPVHSEICFIPMRTSATKGQHFAVRCIDRKASGAKRNFMEGDPSKWDLHRKEGWRIVKVKVVTA